MHVASGASVEVRPALVQQAAAAAERRGDGGTGDGEAGDDERRNEGGTEARCQERTANAAKEERRLHARSFLVYRYDAEADAPSPISRAARGDVAAGGRSASDGAAAGSGARALRSRPGQVQPRRVRRGHRRVQAVVRDLEGAAPAVQHRAGLSAQEGLRVGALLLQHLSARRSEPAEPRRRRRQDRRDEARARRAATRAAVAAGERRATTAAGGFGGSSRGRRAAAASTRGRRGGR